MNDYGVGIEVSSAKKSALRALLSEGHTPFSCVAA